MRKYVREGEGEREEAGPLAPKHPHSYPLWPSLASTLLICSVPAPLNSFHSPAGAGEGQLLDINLRETECPERQPHPGPLTRQVPRQHVDQPAGLCTRERRTRPARRDPAAVCVTQLTPELGSAF